VKASYVKTLNLQKHPEGPNGIGIIIANDDSSAGPHAFRLVSPLQNRQQMDEGDWVVRLADMVMKATQLGARFVSGTSIRGDRNERRASIAMSCS
jgi:hypothetical protein